MLKKNKQALIQDLNTVFDELSFLESLIVSTKETCIIKEFNSIYYDLTLYNKLELSTERNRYISLLTLAEEKINHIKKLHNKIEILAIDSYNKTPTIAADK